MRAPARLVWVALFVSIIGGDFACDKGPSKALVAAMKPLRVPVPEAGGFTAGHSGFTFGPATATKPKPGQRTAHLLGPAFHSSIDADSGAVTVRAEEGSPALTLKPLRLPMRLGRGVVREGRVFFASGDDAVIHTPTRDGVKEDLVLSSPRGDVVEAAWELTLEHGLTAVLEADGSVSVGQPHAQKPLYRLPAPVVRTADGDGTEVQARFWLDGARLVLRASGLAGLSYPIDLDPSVLVLTTQSDLAFGASMDTDVDTDATGGGRVVRRRPGIGRFGSATFNSLTSTRIDAAAVAYNGFVYAIGAEVSTDQIEWAPVTGPGTLGPFSSVDNAFSPRSGLGAAAYNGYLYVVGGGTSSMLYDDVLFARINADGSFGAFTTSPNHFTTARRYHSTVVANGFLYVIAGLDGSATELADVQYAPINADGSIGAFTTQVAPAFTVGRERSPGVAYGGYVYLVGGHTNGTDATDVQYAQQNPDGSLGNGGPDVFTALTQSLLVGVKAHSAVVYDGTLWVIGGMIGSSVSWVVQVAPIKGNGTLGRFIAYNDQYHAFHASAASGGYLYTLGGENFSGTATTAITAAPIYTQPAQLNATATSNTNNTLNSATCAGAAVWNGYAYELGGYAFSGIYNTQVGYAPLNPDGTTLMWSNGGFLPGMARCTRAAVYNGTLYAIGGKDGTSWYPDVSYSQLGANGAPAAFTASTNPLPAARAYPAVAVANGNLYVLGGEDAVGAHSDVWISALGTGGAPGPFQPLTSLADNRTKFAAAVWAGNLYIAGGTNGTTTKSDISYAPINSDGSLGTFSVIPSSASGFTTGLIAHDGALTLMSDSANASWVPLNGLTPLGWNPVTTGLTSQNPYSDNGVVSFNGALISIGGAYNGAGQQGIWANGLNRNSALSAFASSANTLGAREHHCVVGNRGFVYALGGLNAPAGTLIDQLSYAQVNPNGTLAPATPVPTPGFAPRSDMGCAVYKDVLYVVGGNGASGVLSDISWAPLNPNGSVGAFTSGALPVGLKSVGVAIHHGTLYVAGGDNGTTPSSSVYTAPITAGGAPGTFSVSAHPLPSARSGLTLTANDTSLIAVGGFDGTSYLPNVEVSTLASDGTLGAWTAGTWLPGPRSGHAAALYNGRLYISGGHNAQLSFMRDTYYSGLMSKGVGSWTPATVLSTGRQFHGLASAGGALVAVGGEVSGPVASASVESALLPGAQPVGVYTRQIDFGTTMPTVDTLTVNGTAGLQGLVSLRYRTAPSGGAFSAWQPLGPIALGSPITLGQTSIRVVELELTLDDSAAVTVDSVGTVNNLNGSGRERDLTDLSLSYTTPAPTKLAFTSAPQTVTAGACSGGPLTVASEEMLGVPVPVTSDTAVTLSGPAGVTFYADSACMTPLTMVTLAANTSSASAYFKATASGGAMVTATASGLTSTNQTQTVNPAAAAKLSFLVDAAGPYTSNVTISPALKVSILDAYGNATASTASVTLAFGNNPTGASLIGTNTVAAVAGVATFSGLSILIAGTGYTLLASSAGLTSATSAAFNVNAGPVTGCTWSLVPSSSTGGATLTGPPTVTFHDQFNNVVNTSANVTVSLNSGPGTLSGTTVLGATNGVAAFANLSLDKVGAYALRAVCAGVAGQPISGTITVTTGPPGKLTFTSLSPTTSTAGASFSATVQVQDLGGNLVSTATNMISMALGSNPGGGTLSGTTTLSATSGVAAFSMLNVNKVGVGYTLAASSTGLTGGTSGAFTITAAAPAQLAFSVQPPASTSATVAMSPAPQVQVQDTYGNLTASDAGVTVALLNNPFGFGASVFGTNPVSAVAGTAVFSNLNVNKAAMGYTLKATSGTLVQAASAPFDITVGAPTSVVFLQQPTNCVAGNGFTPSVTAIVADPGGNLVSTASANITMALWTCFPTGPAATPLFGTLSQPTSGGLSTFGDLDIYDSGCFQLKASASGLDGGTSNNFTVTAATPSSLYFAAGPPATTPAGSTISTLVGTKDTFGNVASNSGYTMTIALQANPTDAGLGGTLTGSLLTPVITVAGSGYTFQATSSPPLTPVTSPPFNITPAAPHGVVFTVQPTAVMAGAAITPAVKANLVDTYGNLEDGGAFAVYVGISVNPDGGALSGTTPVNAVNGLATFSNLSLNKVGSGYKLSVIADGGTFPSVPIVSGDISAAFDVLGGAPASLYFPPAGPTNFGAATCSPALTVGLKDSFGNPTVAGSGVTVNLAPSGVTLYSDATCTTLATSAGIASGQATGSFYVMGAAMGPFSVTASATSLGMVTLNGSIVPANASKLVITSPAVTATAGACSGPVTVSTQDNAGNPSGVMAMTTLVLSGGANVAFFSDAACSAAVTPLSAGASGETVYFKSTQAQSFTLTANAAGLSSGSQVGEQVVAAAPGQLQFMGAAPTVAAGVCSGLRTVLLTDAFGNSAKAASALSFNLSSSSGGTFYSDAACTTLVTSISIAGGMGSGVLAYKHTVAGTPTVTAQESFMSFSGSEMPTITAAAAAKLQFVSQPMLSTAGAPLAGMVRIEVADAYGNRVTGSTAPVTLALAMNAGNVTLSGTAAVNASMGSALFDMATVNTVGTGYVLQATSAGLTLASSLPFDVVPAAAAVLSFVQQPGNTIAGNPFNPPVKVQAVDAFGNLVPSTLGTVTLALATNPDNVMLNGAVTAALSTGAATFSSAHVDTTGTGYTLVASSSGLMGTSTLFDVAPGAAVKTRFVVQPSNSIAGAAIAPAVQVGLTDTFGNVVSTALGSVTLGLDSSSTPGGALGGMTQTAADAGIATFSNVSLDKTGTYKLVATSGTLTPDTSNAFFVNTSGLATQLVFRPPALAVSTGQCSSRVTVDAMDDGSNVTPLTTDATVTLTGPLGVSFFSDPACMATVSAVTMASGTSAVSFYFTATTAQVTVLTATAPGLRPGSQTETVTGNEAPVINPRDQTVPPGGALRFTGSGGTPPYQWTLMQPSASGGSIDQQGNYTAGAVGGVDDVVELEDSVHAMAQPVAVHVSAPPDAGVPLKERFPVNGWSCGCQASPPVQLLGLVLLVAFGRRRRARGATVALLALTVSALAFAAPKPKIAVLPLKVNGDRDVEKLQKAFLAAATKLSIEQPGPLDLQAALNQQGGSCDDRTECLEALCKATGAAYALSVSIAPDEPSIQMTAKVVRYDGKVMRELGEFEVDKPKNLPRVGAAKKAFDKLFTQLRLETLKAVSVPSAPLPAPAPATPPIAETPPPKAASVAAAPAPEPAPAPSSGPELKPHGKPSIAVLDVEMTLPGEKLDGAAFTEILTSAVDGTQQFKVVSSKDIVAMIGVERQRQLLGCNEESSCMAELTDALGTALLMMASVGKVGDSYLVTARLIESRTHQVSRASLQVKNANLLLDATWKVAQQALDSYGHTLAPDEAERWSKRPRAEPPAAMVGAEPGPSISFSFGVDALALGGLQPLSVPGRRGSIGAQVDLLFRLSRFDIDLGGIVSPTPGARLMLGYAVLASKLRLAIALRGALFPTAGLYGGGAGVNAEFGFGSVFAIVGNAGAEVYPGQGGVVLALLGAIGVGAHF